MTRFGDCLFHLDRSGAFWMPEVSTLVVADLHLEKGSSYARRGVMLPPYDSTVTLQSLLEVVRRLEPKRVVCLGDSFHDMDAPERVAPEDKATLDALTSFREWIWIGGNHDPRISLPFSGTTASEIVIGGVRFRHEPSPGDDMPEVCGHLHPVAKLRMKGQTLRRKCFLETRARWILPAFGCLTGGLNVLDKAFSGYLGPAPMAHMLGAERPYRIELSRLSRD